MRQIILTVLIFIIGFSMSYAQATASFTASATIIQPIGIITTANMNFSSLDAKTGGVVILTPENERIGSGGVELADGTLVSAAAFEVTGDQGFAFSISLPEGGQVLTNGSEEMILRDFTSSLQGSGNFNSGKVVVRVGASLEVNPDQKPGNYTSSSPMNVTVNYN